MLLVVIPIFFAMNDIPWSFGPLLQQLNPRTQETRSVSKRRYACSSKDGVEESFRIVRNIVSCNDS